MNKKINNISILNLIKNNKNNIKILFTSNIKINQKNIIKIQKIFHKIQKILLKCIIMIKFKLYF